MRERGLTILSAVILVLIGVSCILLRVRTQLYSKLAPGESVWRLSYKITVQNIKTGAKLRVALPYSRPYNRVFKETFSHSGIVMDVLRNRQTRGREIAAVPLVGTGQKHFIAHFDIHINPRKSFSYKRELDTKTRDLYLRAEKEIQVKCETVKQIIDELTKNKEDISKEKLLEYIFEYCSNEIVPGNDMDPSDADGTLQQKKGNILGCSRAMVALCRASGIPSRIVTGFILENMQNAQQHFWVQAYLGKEWVPYDTKNGYCREVPLNYMPVRYGNIEIVNVKNADFEKNFSIRRIETFTSLAYLGDKGMLAIVDLTRLPLGIQETLSIILLLPIAAVITVIFRNIIGIGTFGTFTPGLLGLSFVYADWRTGILIFILVMTIGITSRSLLDKLKLLIIPRLSVILTMVVLCITLCVSLLDYYGLTPSARVVLLPIVILTMVIERFQITIEEDGYRQAFELLIGTIVVAFCCFIILQWKDLGRLVLSFPEGLFFIIALFLLLGRYAGYRLTELIRFKDIVLSSKEK